MNETLFLTPRWPDRNGLGLLVALVSIGLLIGCKDLPTRKYSLGVYGPDGVGIEAGVTLYRTTSLEAAGKAFEALKPQGGGK